MNAKETKMLSLIDKQISELQSIKEQLLSTKPLSDIVQDKPWLWVIEKNSNTYYQYKATQHNLVLLDRFGSEVLLTLQQFNSNFRIASSAEFNQHIEYLEKTGKSYIKQDFTQRVEQREASERKVVNLDFASLYQDVMSMLHDIEYQKLVKEKTGIDLDALVTSRINERFNKPCDLSEVVHKIDPKKCDFYMVTVTGEHGSKVRHDRYENAIKEATRLAKIQNHKAWVTGVVAIVEPIKQEVQVKVIEK